MGSAVAAAYAFCVLLETVEQVAYRRGSSTARARWAWIGSGVCCHILGLAAWLWLLALLPLGVALPLMGINYATIALAGRYFFSERLGPAHLVGIGCIVLGVGLICLDGGGWA